jgi:hypothetical protein
LRHEIEVQVHGLKTLLERARCSGGHKIVLFLKGRPVPSATPYPPVDPQDEKLKFQLERKEDSREVWTNLLGRPSFEPREVAVSVGLMDEYPVHSDQKILLDVIPNTWFWTWALVLALLLIAFLALAIKSDVVRDSVNDPVGAARKPYSLAKLQAAWWFFLILTSYLFIGLVTGDYSTSITGTVLSLMGISAATAVGSAVIDAGKRSAFVATGASAGAAGPGAPAAAPAPTGGVGAAAAVGGGRASRQRVTKGWWWLDIVSDENGVNFHRFQMAAWTAVLGVIFVHDVYAGLAMPDFDTTLLGLLGISSGTYLGLKTTSEVRS